MSCCFTLTRSIFFFLLKKKNINNFCSVREVQLCKYQLVWGFTPVKNETASHCIKFYSPAQPIPNGLLANVHGAQYGTLVVVALISTRLFPDRHTKFITVFTAFYVGGFLAPTSFYHLLLTCHINFCGKKND